MRLLEVPASRGLHWIGGGFRVVMRQPLPYIAVYLVAMLGLIVLQGLPFIGAPLAVMLLPAVIVGFVIATETTLAGRVPTPAMLIAALRGPTPRTGAMLQLGAVALLAALATGQIANLLDPGFEQRLVAAMQLPQQPPAPAASAPSPAPPPEPVPPSGDDLGPGLALRLLLLLPSSLLFWHAPVLVYRTGTGIGKALFASAMACWRNLGAFVIYLLGWFVLAAGAGLVTAGVATLIGQPAIAAVMLLPVSVLISAALFASLHFTIADCFDFSGTEPPPGTS